MTDARVAIERLEKLESEATPGPWEFRSGDDRSGMSVDMLMANIAESGEEEEYAEVLWGDELGGHEQIANWDLIVAARNALPALLECARALQAAERAFALLQVDSIKHGIRFTVHDQRGLEESRAALARLVEVCGE